MSRVIRWYDKDDRIVSAIPRSLFWLSVYTRDPNPHWLMVAAMAALGKE
jgi:hypothetical protein